MPEYLAPGVYVEEFDSGAVPIEGVSTSTTGFVGATERGPLQPQLVTSWNEFGRLYGGAMGVDKSYLPYAVQGFFQNGGKRAYIARVANAEDVCAASGDLAGGMAVEAIGPGSWGNRVRVRVARAANFSDANKLYRLTIALYPSDAAAQDPGNADPVQVEDFDNLSLDSSSSTFVGSVVNSASSLIRIEGDADAIDAPDGTDEAGYPNSRAFALAGGAGDSPANKDAHSGTELFLPDGTTYKTGLAGIEEIDDVSILCVPDSHRPEISLDGEIQTQCENLKYRFGILSYASGKTDPAKLAKPLDSQYLAIYTPWVRVYDESVSRWELVPPVGHVAGVYARTDAERGVHKTPANEVVRGIMIKDRGSAKPLERTYTKGHQDVLNPKGINVIRDFRPQGRGIRIWGGRTMSSDGQWKYVSVRRLFIFVEASLDKGTQWVVFEPNDQPTWTRVVASITSFLTRVWKSGALMGSTEQDAFFVRCDRTTMTQDDIDNGRLVCLIGIAPVKPAEFVILRITQKTATADG